MPGESQVPPTSAPDPTVLTTEGVALAVENLFRRVDADRDGDYRVVQEQIAGLRREVKLRDSMREAHRLEQKADGEKTLNAAFASAEAAREQQFTALQKSIEKSESSTTILLANLSKGFDELKQAVGASGADTAAGRRISSDNRALVGVILAALAIAVTVILAFNG